MTMKPYVIEDFQSGPWIPRWCLLASDIGGLPGLGATSGLSAGEDVPGDGECNDSVNGGDGATRVDGRRGGPGGALNEDSTA